MPDNILRLVLHSALCALAISCAAPAAVAQNDNTGDTPPDLVAAEAPAAPTTLDRCFAEKDQLVSLVTSLQRDGKLALSTCETESTKAISGLQDQINACTADETLSLRTNIDLNDQLEACSSALETDTVSSEELKVARAQITALHEQVSQLSDYSSELEADLGIVRATVTQLETRLDELGANLVPEFSYFGADLYESFVRAADIKTLVGPDDVLTAEQCSDALDWLIGMTGEDRALRKVLWVVSQGEFVSCSREPNGDETLKNPTTTDEAHLVRFQ